MAGQPTRGSLYLSGGGADWSATVGSGLVGGDGLGFAAAVGLDVGGGDTGLDEVVADGLSAVPWRDSGDGRLYLGAVASRLR